MTPLDKAREAVEANLGDRKGVLDGVDDLTRADLIESVTVECITAYLTALSEDQATVDRVAAVIALREWEYPAENFARMAAEVDARPVHDGDCTNQSHTCIVCMVEKIRQCAREDIAALATKEPT